MMRETRTHLHFAQLESLRGVAATIVVLYHSPFVAGQKLPLIAAGDLMVDLFFVLSGFVMVHAYGPRVAEGMGFLRYMGLRLGRLYPLHVTVLMAWLAYVATKLAVARSLGIDTALDESVSSQGFVASLLLVQGMGVLDRLGWNAPSWSISVEFFAYMVLFALVRLGRGRILAPAVLLVVASYAFLLLMADRSSGTGILVTYDYGFIRCLGGFFLGVLVHRLWQMRPVTLTGWRAGTVELAILAALGVTLWVGHESGALQLVSIALSALLIYTISGSRGAVRAVLEAGPLRYLGRISYSIYLVHGLVLTLALNFAEHVLRWPVGTVPGTRNAIVETAAAPLINLGLVAVVIVISAVTWRRIERPGQRLARWFLEGRGPLARSAEEGRA